MMWRVSVEFSGTPVSLAEAVDIVRCQLECLVLNLIGHRCQRQPGGWIPIKVEEGVHVIPLDDEVEHEAWAGCLCGPQFDGAGLYKHSSLDGRELSEAEA